MQTFKSIDILLAKLSIGVDITRPLSEREGVNYHLRVTERFKPNKV